MLSNNDRPRSTSLQPCTSTSGLYSYCRNSTCSACNSRSHSTTFISPRTRTRTGSVLMNNPNICSTPLNSAGRPDTTAPNTTSSAPLYRLSSNPHAPCTIVISVNCCCRPNCCNLNVAAALISSRCSPYSSSSATPRSLLARSRPNSVAAVKPFSFSRQ